RRGDPARTHTVDARRGGQRGGRDGHGVAGAARSVVGGTLGGRSARTGGRRDRSGLYVPQFRPTRGDRRGAAVPAKPRRAVLRRLLAGRLAAGWRRVVPDPVGGWRFRGRFSAARELHPDAGGRIPPRRPAALDDPADQVKRRQALGPALSWQGGPVSGRPARRRPGPRW